MTPEQQRVRILSHRLPLEIAANLVGRIRWLRQQLPSVDRAIEMQYPPIEITPYWIYETFGDGRTTMVNASIGLRPSGDSHVFTVTIAAPTMLEYEDDLIVWHACS